MKKNGEKFLLWREKNPPFWIDAKKTRKIPLVDGKKTRKNPPSWRKKDTDGKKIRKNLTPWFDGKKKRKKIPPFLGWRKKKGKSPLLGWRKKRKGKNPPLLGLTEKRRLATFFRQTPSGKLDCNLKPFGQRSRIKTLFAIDLPGLLFRLGYKSTWIDCTKKNLVLLNLGHSKIRNSQARSARSTPRGTLGACRRPRKKKRGTGP